MTAKEADDAESWLFWLQLSLGLLWGLAFFRWEWYGLSWVLIMLLVGTIVETIRSYREKGEDWSAILGLPYFGWSIFLVILTWSTTNSIMQRRPEDGGLVV